MFLLSSKYAPDKNKVVAFFLKDGRLETVTDWTGHKPYFYTTQTQLPEDSRITGVSNETKIDLMQRKQVNLRKIFVSTPIDVGGRDGLRNIISPTWEDNIKYHWLWLYDNNIIPCIDYEFINGVLTPNITDVSDDPLENLMGQPIPEIPFATMDIEVDSNEFMPNPEEAKYPISCISIITPAKKIVLLNRDNEVVKMDNTVVVYYTNEANMITDALKELSRWPVVITFNGFNFDFAYLYQRGINLGLTISDMELKRYQYGVGPRNQIHLDFFLFFTNPTVQNYIYGSKYKYNGLDDISQALLGRGKRANGKIPAQMPAQDLAEYCLNDSQLLWDLAENNQRQALRIIITISRLCKIPIEDVCIWGTNKWVQSLITYEHKKYGYLIPNRAQLGLGKHAAATKAIIKGKKYKGATVLKPKRGLHFNVKVLDAASLYSTIIARYNLSYETVNCPHQDCKTNTVPETPYWVCQKETGIISKIIKSLRDLRVDKIKPKAKNDPFWEAVSQGTKTILNAVYGVIGFESFPLYYLPMPESITAYERSIMSKLYDKCKELGLEVLYSDTDSLGINNSDKIDELLRYGKELDIDLEVDKSYVWVALTERKKNYVGYTDKGDLIIRGLQGKKVHTPPLVTKSFNQITNLLKSMRAPEDLEAIKPKIQEIVTEGLRKLKELEYPLFDYEFKMIAKREEYKTETVDSRTGKTRIVKPPMHIRAAREEGEVKAGKVIKFVKTIIGPRSTNLASIEQIDTGAYIGIYQSSMEQILDALNLRFVDMGGLKKLEIYEYEKPAKASAKVSLK